jgi:hypothetical protein
MESRWVSLATKVFISWSGDLSRKLGEALRDWLPASLQYVKPYFSPQDTEKGRKWDSEIAKELADSDIGVLCLTRENFLKPWILFEAGALSKSITKARVCPLLFNLEPPDVTGPLTSFQHTSFVKDDFRKLVETINSAAGENSLDVAVLGDVFDMWWPQLESKVTAILASHVEEAVGERRADRDILEEILSLARTTPSRVDRLPPFSLEAFDDLVLGLDELVFSPGAEARRVIDRLARPVEYICRRTRNQEAQAHWEVLKRRVYEDEPDFRLPILPSDSPKPS